MVSVVSVYGERVCMCVWVCGECVVSVCVCVCMCVWVCGKRVYVCGVCVCVW